LVMIRFIEKIEFSRYMRILSKNLRQGTIEIKVDSAQDLWYLSQLILAGDRAGAKTERKIKLGSAEGKQSVVKKSMYLKIAVERVEFKEGSESLRVMGVVLEGSDDVPQASHHTLEVEPGTSITIEKDEWLSFQLGKLEEAASASNRKTLVVVFDREEALFALLKNQGFEIVLTLKGDVAKKRFEQAGKGSFYSEISKHIEELSGRFSADHIVAASPSFWKEYLAKEMPDELRRKVILSTTSEVSESGIREVMQRPELSRMFEGERAAMELSVFESILRAISKGEACYGINECSEMVENGAVSELAVSYEMLSEDFKKGSSSLEQLMKKAEQRGAKVHLLSTKDIEKKLTGLGGVAGILRWKKE
jgi:protein pelota